MKTLESSLQEARNALKDFVQSLDTAEEELQRSIQELNEALIEEREVQEIIESSGNVTADLSRQLSQIVAEAQQANEVYNKAQEEVNRTATQAELITEQLSQAQQTSEEYRLALGELEIEGEEFNTTNPKRPRSIVKKLTLAQSSEEKLVWSFRRLKVN